MGERLTAWHYFLGLLLAEQAPRCFEVRAEEPLTRALQHMDFLVLRRRPWKGVADHGTTLVLLWPLLPAVTIVEFKSATKGYRAGDLHRLIGYGHQYFSVKGAALAGESDLALVLMVASRNAALDRDLERLGLRQRAIAPGYTRLEGLTFPMVLVDLAALTAQDRDDHIALFAGNGSIPAAAWSWWYARYGLAKEEAMDPTKLEDFEAMQRRFLDSLPVEDRLAGIRPEDRLAGLRPEQRLAGLRPEDRLAGLAPEQRLAGLAPEQRLAGLTEAETLLAMPDAALAALSDAYVDSLPEAVRDRVRARRARR